MDLPQNAGAPSARDIANNEEHHVVNQSDGEKHEDYMDDDDDSFSTTSSLSIPNESIDFDLVYALHTFAATVEGQANVVKGDSLFLMDDSNSYWWLVRVLKTQEVGYIPAENIETPFERLGRLNRHRNVDIGLVTQPEPINDLKAFQDRLHNPPGSPNGTIPHLSDSRAQSNKMVMFAPALSVHRYLPAIWNEEEEEDPNEEWDNESYEDEEPETPITRSSGVMILLLGQTGIGKRTFINVAAGKDVAAVGDSQDFSSVEPFVVQHYKDPTRRVVFVDTPGLDDTWQGDVTKLGQIAHWLKGCSADAEFGGIVYLHDTTHSQSDIAPTMLTRLGLPCDIVYGTVTWEVQGHPRTNLEKMIHRKSQVTQITNTKESVWSLVDNLIQESPVSLGFIQEELSMLLGGLSKRPAGQRKWGFFSDLAAEQTGESLVVRETRSGDSSSTTLVSQPEALGDHGRSKRLQQCNAEEELFKVAGGLPTRRRRPRRPVNENLHKNAEKPEVLKNSSDDERDALLAPQSEHSNEKGIDSPVRGSPDACPALAEPSHDYTFRQAMDGADTNRLCCVVQ